MGVTAIVLPHEGRFLVCRVSIHKQLTPVSSHLNEGSALEEARGLDARLVTENRAVVVVPPELRQIPFGFYTDEDAA
jgi:hypothetical protein